MEEKNSGAARQYGCTVTLVNGEAFGGYLYSEYFRRAVRFEGAVAMTRAMFSLLNAQRMPAPFFELRRFHAQGRSKIIIKRAVTVMEQQELERTTESGQVDAKATFVVNVRFRRNTTWQGSITWTERGVTRQFRSALEMLRLMDDAQPVGAEVLWDEDPGSE